MSYSGKFKPKNYKKYKGDPTKIYYRSLWERRFMVYCDNNSKIIEWGSEEIVIPYKSPLDQKTHRYFPDFYVKYINKDMDEITLEDVVEYINKKSNASSNIIKQLNDDISIRKGKYGPYVFYKTSSMNRPKFISMKGVAEDEVTISWVEANLNN